MSFVDRSLPNGDREETNEELDKRYFENLTYFEVVQKHEEEQLARSVLIQHMLERYKNSFQDQLTALLPSCFKSDRYYNQSDKYKYYIGRKNLYKTIGQYVDVGKNFYCQVLHSFAKKNNILDIMPDYVKIYENKDYDLEQTKNKVVELESLIFTLIQNCKDVSISDFFKSQKNLTRFTKFLAQGWMVYFDMKDKNYFHVLVNAQQKYDLSDKNNENEIITFYAAQVRASIKIDPYFKNMFEVNQLMYKTNGHCAPYSYITDIQVVYRDLLQTLNAFDSIKIKQEIEENNNIITSELNKDIMYIYQNYEDVYRVVSFLRNIEPRNVSNYSDIFSYEQSKRGRDLFQTALNYYNILRRINENIPENELYKRIKLDIKNMQYVCAEMLKLHHKAYQQYQKELEEFNLEYFINKAVNPDSQD